MRVKTGNVRTKKHKKVLKQAKGFRWRRSNVFSHAKNAVMKAGQHAYVGRKNKKRDFRKLWIMRISAALKILDKNYSVFFNHLKKKNIVLDRKILADLAVQDPEIFGKIVNQIYA